MSDEEQAELQAANLTFYPPLGVKTRESCDMHLTTASGKIYRGIRVWRGKTQMPSSVTLHNRPEIPEREVQLSPTTQKRLIARIRDRLFNVAAGLE